MKTFFIHFFTMFILFSCNNANLYDPAESNTDQEDIEKTSPLVCEKTCIHPEATDFSNEVTSNEPGACEFTACMDESYAEYSKVLDYSTYTDLYGGKISHDITKCVEKLEYGEGCSYKGAINFVNTSSDKSTACYFTGCSDPNFAEHWDYLAMKNYASKVDGSTITHDENKCITRIRGCNSTSTFVAHGNSESLYDDGSCSFSGCSDPGYDEYRAEFISDLNAYKASFKGCLKPTGSIDDTCKSKKGCTTESASNYDINAVVEDGSCNFNCCSTYNSAYFDPDCENQVNKYLEKLETADPQITHTGIINKKFQCGKMLGCALNHPYVSNTVANSQENGSCDISCCAQSGALNYDPSCQQMITAYSNSLTSSNLTPTGNFVTNACQFPAPGCYFESPYVSNYQPRTVENGSCDISCCADPTKENYDPKCKAAIDQYDGILNAANLTYSGVKNTNFNCGKVKGCYTQSPFTTNYDATTTEDGSCDIECCSDSTRVGYNQACIGAKNTYVSKLRSMGLTTSGNINIYKCGPKLGCNYEGSLKPEYVKNYDPAAQENGTCTIQCCGQKGKEKYDPLCQQVIDGYLPGTKPVRPNVNNNFNCGSELNCNYSGFGVTNSVPGTSENGSCIIQCCGQEGYENYSPACQRSINSYTETLRRIGIIGSTVPDSSYNCGRKKGCTLVGASNFNAAAQLDDGSCSFSCRKCDSGYEFGTDQNCIDTWNGYKAKIANQGITLTGDFSFTNSCGSPKGCNYSDTRVTNYNSMSIEDGSCKIECCSLEGYQFYDDKCLSTVEAYNSYLPTGITGVGPHNTRKNCGQQVGCTYNQYVTNKTPGATLEDGSCDIACCSDSSKENYQAGCSAAVTGYENLLGSITPTGTINKNANCGKELGCNYSNDLVQNFTAGTSENGSCEIECCSIPGYENYDLNCRTAINGYLSALNIENLSASAVNGNFNCGRKLGCSQPALVDASGQPGNAANLEDGSCIVRCCGDSAKENYAADCSQKAIDYINLLNGMNLNAQNQPDQGYMCGRDLGCSYSAAGSYVKNLNFGSKEDGSCDIKCCGIAGKEEYSANCNAYIDSYKDMLSKFGIATSGMLDNNFECGETLGCMNPKAINYNSSATADPNKVCDFQTCTNSNYENYDQSIIDAFNAYDGGRLFSSSSAACGNRICPAGYVGQGDKCICAPGTILCHGQCVPSCPVGYDKTTDQYGTPVCKCASGTYQSSNGLTCE